MLKAIFAIFTSSNMVTSIIGTPNQILANNSSGSSQTGNVTLTLPSTLVLPGTIGNQVLVSPQTGGSPYSVLTTDSNTYFTNEGAAAKVFFNLPTTTSNLIYSFIVQNSNGIRIVANSGDTLRFSGAVSAVAGFAESTTVGSTVEIVAINSTEWIATAINGTWSIT